MVLRSEWNEMTQVQKDLVEQHRLKVTADLKSANDTVKKQIDDEHAAAKADRQAAAEDRAAAAKELAAAKAYKEKVADHAEAVWPGFKAKYHGTV